MPVVGRPTGDRPNVRFHLDASGGGIGGNLGQATMPIALVPDSANAPAGTPATPARVSDFAKKVQVKPGDLQENRGKLEDDKLKRRAVGRER